MSVVSHWLAFMFGVALGLSVYDAHSAELTAAERKAWISTIQNQEKGTCCSEADGQSLRTDEWEARGDAYWVYLHQDQKWHKVEDWMLVTVPNLVGYAMVWVYAEQPPGVFGEDYDYTVPLIWNVRCFIPGALT